MSPTYLVFPLCSSPLMASFFCVCLAQLSFLEIHPPMAAFDLSTPRLLLCDQLTSQLFSYYSTKEGVKLPPPYAARLSSVPIPAIIPATAEGLSCLHCRRGL